jgi:hypothetical protein
MYSRPVVLLVLAGSLALAQDDPISIADATSQAMPLVAPRSSLAYTAPALKENFRYAFHSVFSPGKLLVLGVEAAMDQARELPMIWAQGMQGFRSRYADRFDRSLVREHVTLGVRLLTGGGDRGVICAVNQASGNDRDTP